MNLVLNEYGRYNIIDDNGKLQGCTDPGNFIIVNNHRIYEMYHTAWGWVLRIGEETERLGFRWLYMSKVFKGKYTYMLDNLYAKNIKSKKLAEEHLKKMAIADGYRV